MKEAPILQILCDLDLERRKIRQYVAMRQDDSFGLRRRARGEYDLQGVTRRELGGATRGRGVATYRFGKFFEPQRGQRALCMLARGDNQLCANLAVNPEREVGSG